MSIVFGVKIDMNDYDSPLTEDTDIGLYSIETGLNDDPGPGSSMFIVLDISEFSAGMQIRISDSEHSELLTISSTSCDIIYTTTESIYGYSVANGAKINTNSQFRWQQNEIDGLIGFV